MIFFKLEKKINYFLLKFLNRINNSRVSFVSCDFLLLIDEYQQKNKKNKNKNKNLLDSQSWLVFENKPRFDKSEESH